MEHPTTSSPRSAATGPGSAARATSSTTATAVRLGRTREPGEGSPAPSAQARDARTRSVIEALAWAAVAQRRHEIDAILRDAGRQGASWWSLCQEMVAPAVRLTGEWWREDGCTFLEVTMATAELHRAIRRIGEGDRIRAPRAGRTILLSAAPGAQHTLGMLLVADRMKRLGWRVEIGWPFRSPKAALDGTIDVVGLSVSGSRDFPWALDWARRVNERFVDANVLLGGNGAAQLKNESGLRAQGDACLAVLTAVGNA